MSERMQQMVDQVHQLAAGLSRIRSTPAKVEVIPKVITDRQQATRRNRLEDPKEILALKRRLGLMR